MCHQTAKTNQNIIFFIQEQQKIKVDKTKTKKIENRK